MPDDASAANTRTSRLVAMVVLILAVCGFGAVSLCGGVVTALSYGEPGYAGAFLVVSVPSLLIGALLCYVCARQLLKVWRRLDPPDEP